ncbi:MAG: HAMP domain-containing sensor histidine kinase [Chloroflexi bacterium]|nr:HAMP domain-containing sensor histidine kinase [Chloroflexota bacterium]
MKRVDMHHSLTLYSQLSRSRWPQSYLSKFLLVAFIGVHIPLLSLVLHIILQSSSWSVAWPTLLVTLVATLAGSLLTIVIQHHLLAPVAQTSQALYNYLQQGQLPQLPVQFRDEAGLLMANAQHCVTSLDQLLKLKSDMLAIVAHDLRSPLTTIMIANEMIGKTLEQMDVDASLVEKYTDRIHTAAKAQMALVNHTLNLVLSESGKITAQPSEIALNGLLHQVFTETKPQADYKGICYLAPTVAPEINIRADVPKTIQILSNLVNNAIKFTPAGGTIELAASYNAEMLEFRIKDSGLGMDSAEIQQLFQPFSSAQRPGTAQEQGFGLGLWICKIFTEAQGGSLAVDSQPGQGSCFTVSLPMALASS